MLLLYPVNTKNMKVHIAGIPSCILETLVKEKKFTSKDVVLNIYCVFSVKNSSSNKATRNTKGQK